MQRYLWHAYNNKKKGSKINVQEGGYIKVVCSK